MSSPTSPPSPIQASATPEDILTLATRYMDKVEEFATKVTVAVGQLDKARGDYETAKSNFKVNWLREFGDFLKAAAPYVLPIILIIGIYKIPCGTNWEGGGVKFSSRPCPAQTVPDAANSLSKPAKPEPVIPH